MEYFIVLFGIRYDKHWRQKKDLERIAAVNHHPVPNRTDHSKLFLNSKVQPHSDDAKNTEQKTENNVVHEEFQAVS